jgi:hypothetical protein
MATYFGYVEREADSYVNWADVGRNMSATIDNIQRVRDEKKALIEKAYREDLDYIQSRPSGEHETLNAWSLNFGNTSAENLKVNDFVTFRQNLSDSVEKIYTVNAQLQEAFKKVNDRTKASANQEIERATKVLLEKYGALENTLPYVNSLTGSVAIGLTEITKDAEGKEVRKLRQGDDAYLTPAQLQAASMQEFNNFDPEPVLENWVNGFGKVKESIRSVGGETFSGMITSIEDIKGDRWMQIAKENKLSDEQIAQIQGFIDDFKKSENLFIDGVLENEFDASAILTEKVGTIMINGQPVPYKVVFNENEQTSDQHLYVEKTKDGRFIPRFDTEIGKKQKDVLRGYLRSQLTPKYDRIVQQQPYNEPRKERVSYPPPNETLIKKAEKDKRMKTLTEKIRLLREGNAAQKATAFDWIRSQKGISQTQSLYETDNDGNEVIKIFSSDPDKPEPYIYKFGSNVPIDDFVNAVAGYAFPDLAEDYSSYIEDMDKTSIENPEQPYSIEYNRNLQKIKDLQTELQNNPLMRTYYQTNITLIEERNKELKEKMNAQGQGGGVNYGNK